MNNKTVLFLFTELSGYILACFNFASENGYNVHVVNYPINSDAPFEIEKQEKKTLFFHSKKKFNTNKKLNDFVLELSPGIIFVSGWMDKQYFKFSTDKNNSFKKILLLDNTWLGSLKQNLWSFLFKNRFKNAFQGVWTPGHEHKTYANKLGFKDVEIQNGFYTCDTNLFNSFYLNNHLQKQSNFPKNFLYVGRYDDVKGIRHLWNSFINVVEKNNFNWELWCVGTGKMWDSRVKHPLIKHFGFVQPDKLIEIVQDAGIYILPSKYEPWGVSLHEMVSLGMPVLISENIGSKIYFFKEKINGMSFSHLKENDLENKIYQMINLSKEELFEMGRESVNLSKKFSLDSWLETLNKFYD
jgi:glycosyltransferase involved in cell wall biosynthesis